MNIRPFLAMAGLVIAVMLAASAWASPQVPADAVIPVHWGLDGQPDGYAAKPVGLLGLPAIATLLAGVLAIVPRIEPRRENLERSATAYRRSASAILVIFGVVHGAVVATAVGYAVNVPALVTVAVGGLFIVIGNYLGKVRSNFLFGIRTPWTLTSERSWAQTHRLAGRLMVALGAGLVLAVVLGLRGLDLFPVVGIGAAGLVAIVFVYSWLVWRDDPDPQTVSRAR